MSAPPPTASSLLIVAVGHAASAQLLHEIGGSEADNGRYSASMWFLMGWAVELTLKSVILHLGGTVADCRAVGHNLPHGLIRAQQLGFVTKLTNVQNLVDDLQITHGNFFFRYMPEFDTEVPGNSQLANAVLQALLAEVGGLQGLPHPY